jgi:hypothetical protein
MFNILFKLFLLLVKKKGKPKIIKCYNGLDFFNDIMKWKIVFDMFVLLEKWKGL